MKRRSLRIRDELAAAAGDQFEILREVGRGGMGWVFLARDLRLNRRVALKVLSPGLLMEDGMGERFLREAQILASLRHAHIVGVHSVHQVGDLHFFAMDFIDGPSLDRVLRTRAPLGFRPIRTIAYMIGSALDYGHHRGRGVIHRDIKPANVILDSDGSVVVTDFGISKVLAGNTRLTRTGIVVGTPEFMSPEQCGGLDVTAASDQYSLGVLLYQMLTGAPPFTGSTVEVLLGHVQGTPKPVVEGRPDCPEPVAEAVERMLEKAPEKRFPDIAVALEALGARPVGLRSPERRELTSIAHAAVDVTGAIDVASPLSPARGLDGDRLSRRAQTAAAGGGRPAGEDVGATEEAETTGSTYTISDLHIGSPRSRLEPGDSMPIWVHARDSGGIAVPDAPVRLSVDNPEIASLDEGGLLVARRSGTVTVTATTGEIERHVTLEIIEPRRASRILVDPPEIRLAVGEELALEARVLDTAGEEMAAEVVWVLDGEGAFVLEGSRLKALHPGEGAVTASSGLVSTTVRAQARSTPVAVVLDGAPEECVAGDEVRVVPLVVDREGIPIPDAQVEWTSSDPSVAEVDDEGVVRAHRSGSVSIRAAHAGLDTGFELRVVGPPQVAEAGGVVAGSGEPGTVEAGEVNAVGTEEGSRAVGQAAPAQVDEVPGARPARRVPPIVIGVAGVAVLAVGVSILSSMGGSDDPEPLPSPQGPPVPAAITFTLEPLTPLAVGDSVRAVATLPESYDGPTEWSSDAPGVASVSADGLVRGLAEGVATIALRAGGREETVEVRVTPRPPIARGPEPPSRGGVEDEPEPAPVPPATVRIQVIPDGITSVDGVPRPDTLLRTNTLELAPGEYRLQLSKPGFLPFDTTVVLSPGQELVIRKRLAQSGSR